VSVPSKCLLEWTSFQNSAILKKYLTSVRKGFVTWKTGETAEFDTWFDSLSQRDQIQVVAAIEYLKETGPAAKMPVSRPIKQANIAALRELRPGSSGTSELRILYAFDRQRRAVLLLGGDKSDRSNDWAAWYDRNVPAADQLFSKYQSDSESYDRQTKKRTSTKRDRTKRR
jgi:hypothetical protein